MTHRFPDLPVLPLSRRSAVSRVVAKVRWMSSSSGESGEVPVSFPTDSQPTGQISGLPIYPEARPLKPCAIRGASIPSTAVVLMLWAMIWAPAVIRCQEPAGEAAEQQVEATGESPVIERQGILVRIPLPITPAVETRLLATLERSLERLPTATAAADRPVLILEFDTLRGANGRGSRFESCLALARYLTGPALDRVRTVAYLPAADDPAANSRPLAGHAILVALACETWVLQQQAGVTAAASDEPVVDPLILEAYRSVAARRQVVPQAVVDTLVDSTRGLVELETLDGQVRYVAVAELEKLEQEGNVARSETLAEPGELPVFDAKWLFRRGWTEGPVSGRIELATRLEIPAAVVEGDPSLGGDWTAVRVRLTGALDRTRIDWILAALEQRLASGTDLVVWEIDSAGGSMSDVARLARRLHDLDPVSVRTVAYVGTQARGASVLVAAACDHLIMDEDTLLGGIGVPPLDDSSRAALSDVLATWNDETHWDRDLVLALIDPATVVHLYRHGLTGEERFLTEASATQLEDRANWSDLGPISTEKGLSDAEAFRLGLARRQVRGFDELASLYRLPANTEVLEPTPAFQGIEAFARFIARPWIAWWLLLIGMMCISTEMSSPGIGLPGFVGAICFTLFFWSQYLDGNAHWLEILLFLLGLSFVLMELFVVPGFGLFGIGGIVLMLTSIVLASQTFVWPATSEDFEKLPQSLAMILALGLGLILPMMVLPRYFDRIPILRRLSLNPDRDVAFREVERREAVVDWKHLEGKMGLVVSPLIPGGKIQVGDDVVSAVTDGRSIDVGERVVVRLVQGNRIVVDPMRGAEHRKSV